MVAALQPRAPATAEQIVKNTAPTLLTDPQGFLQDVCKMAYEVTRMHLWPTRQGIQIKDGGWHNFACFNEVKNGGFMARLQAIERSIDSGTFSFLGSVRLIPQQRECFARC